MAQNQYAAMSGVPFLLQTAATTGSGTILAIPQSFTVHSFIISVAAGVTAGAVQIEKSNDPADANTWDPLTASPTSVATAASTDISIDYIGRLNFVRARVTTTISGGGSPSITATYLGAKGY
jgi:hypothetical protein